MGWLTWFGGILHGEKALLRHLRQVARCWPPLARKIFEFYYVDGLSLADIASMTGCTAKAFHAHLLFIQRHLRNEIIKQALYESRTAIPYGVA